MEYHTCTATLSSNMHEHTLTLVDFTGYRSGRVCDVCSRPANKLVYQCKACGFDVHPRCTKVPRKLKHALHPNHHLVLEPPTSKSCAVCRGVCTSWQYSCKSCGFHIHPQCALESISHSNSNTIIGVASVMGAPQDNPIRKQITSPTSVSLSYMHKHTLSLVDFTGYRSGRVCDVCGHRVNELVYQCKPCGFDVHPHCTLIPRILKHALHPNHQLVLQPSKTKSCAACRGVCTNWEYSCKSCGFHIHPECAFEKLNHSNSKIRILAATTLTPERVHGEVPPGYVNVTSSKDNQMGHQITCTTGVAGTLPQPIQAKVSGGHASMMSAIQDNPMECQITCPTRTAATLTPQPLQVHTLTRYSTVKSSPQDNLVENQITCSTSVTSTLSPQAAHQTNLPRGFASVVSSTQDNPLENKTTCPTSIAAAPIPEPVEAEVPRGYAIVTIAPKDNPIGRQITLPTKTTLSSYMHKHILTLKDYTGCRSSRVCDVCSQKVNELVYQCKACGFDVHPLCTQFPKQLKHALHSYHQLVLQPSTTRSCAVCHGACTSWRYSCKSCDFHIHPKCVLQNSCHSNSNSNSNTNIRATTTLTPQPVQAEVPHACSTSVTSAPQKNSMVGNQVTCAASFAATPTPQLVQTEVSQGYSMTSAPQDDFNYFAPNMQYEFTNNNVPHYYPSQYNNSGSYPVQGSGGNADNPFGFGGNIMYDIVQDLAAGVISNVISGAIFS